MTDAEVVVKSDVWEVPGTGEYVWIASIADGWSSQGKATSPGEAMVEIERQLAIHCREEPETVTRAVVIHHDGPSLS